MSVATSTIRAILPIPLRTAGFPRLRPVGLLGGFRLHTAYPAYKPNYTSARYAKGYDMTQNTRPLAFSPRIPQRA